MVLGIDEAAMTVGDLAPLSVIDDPYLVDHGVTLSVLRLDEFCPNLSGNKFFKLKYNLLELVARGYRQIISFGGAYSNHIHALAFAAKALGLNFIAVIRGEAPQVLNSTLQEAKEAGAILHFVSREQYRHRHSVHMHEQLIDRYGQAYIIPEGGSNALAVKGCREIVQQIQAHKGGAYDMVFVPCGTGGTLAGLAAGLPVDKQLIGISALKGGAFLETEVRALLKAANIDVYAHWRIIQDYHFGGYAKCNKALAVFMANFKKVSGVGLEPIYTAKMFYALYDLLARGQIAAGSRIIAIHTGGMQGLRGMQARLDQLLSAE